MVVGDLDDRDLGAEALPFDGARRRSSIVLLTNDCSAELPLGPASDCRQRLDLLEVSSIAACCAFSASISRFDAAISSSGSAAEE